MAKTKKPKGAKDTASDRSESTASDRAAEGGVAEAPLDDSRTEAAQASPAKTRMSGEDAKKQMREARRKKRLAERGY